MNSISKIAGLSALFLIGVFAIHNQAGFSAAMVVQDCVCGTAGCAGGCGIKKRRGGCRKCGSKRGCRKCPKCLVECCQLEVKESESKETCFMTEQKIVCIPRVRMPWQKCCPPGKSKTRTINVLKTHSFKCPSCEYKWTLVEPEIPESSDENQQLGLDNQPIKLSPEYDGPTYEPVPAAPPFEGSASSVPAPPPTTYDPSVPAGSR